MTDPCQHDSRSGDEGPVRDLPGGLDTVVRWRCDGCDAVLYDDAALERLRAKVDGLQLALEAVKEAGWNRPAPAPATA
jgi:hypothetical protein